MKKNYLLWSAALVLLATCFVMSCKKYDHLFIQKICRIDKVDVYAAEGVLPRYVSYDQWDNPVEVKFDEIGTGRETYKFYYDSQHRLKGYDGYESHTYTYDKKGMAAIDTIHANYTGQDLWLAEKIFYDEYGRIIRTETKLYDSFDPQEPGLGETVTKQYVYDNNGNLVIPGVTYDNKVNMLRTNKIWMLIEKNYSKNNPVFAGTDPLVYNAYGLPLNPRGSSFLRHGVDKVYYDCGKDDHK